MKINVENRNNECYTVLKSNSVTNKELNNSHSDLASYIINERIKIGVPVTNVLLQYLLYYVQSFCISAQHSTVAFSEEITVTPTGPFVMSIYNKYIYYKNNKILELQPISSKLESTVLGIANRLIIKTIDISQDNLFSKIQGEAPWLLTPLFHPVSCEILIAEFEFKNIENYF